MVIFMFGAFLTSVNIYGIFMDIRPTVFFEEELRFAHDSPIPLKETLQQITKKNSESNLHYSERVTKVIAQSVAHIHWEKYDAEKFNQLIPLWENYILYMMGKLSNIPEYQKYHFANYERSLKRGIGICGDASMIMSQLLTKNNIPNQIITFPGHVIVSAKINENETLFDPDFGVVLPFSPDEIKDKPSLVNDAYLAAGYYNYDIKAFNRIYNNTYQRWDGVKHFITNKYYFEKIAYIIKWPFPIILILVGLYLFNRLQNKVYATKSN
jgi:hypothetical protein